MSPTGPIATSGLIAGNCTAWKEEVLVLDKFTELTTQFLLRSDLSIDVPDIIPAELLPDGRSSIHICSSTIPDTANIKDNPVLTVTVLFSLLDVLADQRFPELEGQSFKKRYDGLPASNDYDTIFKELYRIMRLFRNAIVHCKSGISMSEESFDIDYNSTRGTLCKLEITRRACHLLFSLIVHYFRVRRSSYMEGIVRSYFDDIRNGIKRISDDISVPLRNISNCGLRLKRSRYRVINPNYNRTKHGTTLQISRYQLLQQERDWRGVEYNVSLGGVEYMIPDEALENDNEISVSGLEHWKYDKDGFFH